MDDFTNHAIDFMEKNSAKPFLVYLPYNTPHSPFIVPKPFWNNFKDKAIPQRGVEGDREDIDVTRAVLAMCENIDVNVGRVLSKIENLGIKENTIVLYFSDNGPNSFRFNGKMKGRKGSTDEGGVRSPGFISWPGKLPGEKLSQKFVVLSIFFPRFFRLVVSAGLETNHLMEGIFRNYFLMLTHNGLIA